MRSGLAIALSEGRLDPVPTPVVDGAASPFTDC